MPLCTFFEKDFLFKYSYFDNNGFGHHIVNDKFYFA
jgi:hypothetical protein